ncbi:MAG: aminotransferase class V-fold PLP-dependent enzyme [Gemmatimonadetes bacterium]|nr:aminotransferase class V-fold PLP-dependent enzyme [Gemmatimonadota bacterium]
MARTAHTRRDFLQTLGALSAAGLAPRSIVLGSRDMAATGYSMHVARGLAPSPDDFAFAPGLVYLQTGSLGPTPRPVMERTIAAWKQLELDPVAYGYGEQEHAMDEVRAQAAAFLHCKTEELVLTRSTTDGMNWVAQGLTLGGGDRVLTTDQEHPGGRAAYSTSSGVTSIPSVLGVGAAIAYLSAIGLASIESHNLGLRNRLFAALADVPKLRVVSAPPGPLASPLLTFALPDDIKSDEFQKRLRDKHNVQLKVVPKNWLNGNRVSTHLFNTEQDVDALIVALKAELT